MRKHVQKIKVLQTNEYVLFKMHQIKKFMHCTAISSFYDCTPSILFRSQKHYPTYYIASYITKIHMHVNYMQNATCMYPNMRGKKRTCLPISSKHS
uniref:DNA topoisomerase n=1 Tax=Rhizophora mucronata TaxID=61149 RepID=A0A2P2LI97_RHIMU